MAYYAVIDTNVLVSAMLKWDSVPGNIMEFAFEGPIIPILNEAIVKEYREVLSRSKFHLTEEIVNDVIDAIHEHGIYVDAETIDIELPDPKDRVFYEVVMEELLVPSPRGCTMSGGHRFCTDRNGVKIEPPIPRLGAVYTGVNPYQSDAI